MALGSKYVPHEGSPCHILLEHGRFETINQMAVELGVAYHTIRRWDEGEYWPHWALEKMGFTVMYGEPEVQPLEELEHLRDRIDELISEYYGGVRDEI